MSSHAGSWSIRPISTFSLGNWFVHRNVCQHLSGTLTIEARLGGFNLRQLAARNISQRVKTSTQQWGVTMLIRVKNTAAEELFGVAARPRYEAMRVSHNLQNCISPTATSIERPSTLCSLPWQQIAGSPIFRFHSRAFFKSFRVTKFHLIWIKKLPNCRDLFFCAKGKFLRPLIHLEIERRLMVTLPAVDGLFLALP